MINYNDIDWNAFLYYDETSPSCLRWKINITNCFHKKKILVHKDLPAGTKQYRKTGNPKAWVITYNGRQYVSHRIIAVLVLKENIANKVIDHLDRNPFNNKVFNLKVKSVAENNRNMPKNKNNKTGVTGVCYTETNNCNYYIATWSVNGKPKSKHYSLLKYTREEAFKLACEHREKMLKLLNENGCNYEENHGK
jgi:hypothetical protein